MGLNRPIGNIVLRDVNIYDRPVTAPRSVPNESLVSPNGRTYWPFDDGLLRPLLPELVTHISPADADEAYDPANAKDARDRVLRAIKARRGQKGFREALLAAYGGRCAVTGCAIRDVLEAAHITPYLGPEPNHVSNGLLLRADLHTLYDCGLVAIQPEALTVVIAPSLTTSSYRKLADRPLRSPIVGGATPSRKALAQHFAEFQKRHSHP